MENEFEKKMESQAETGIKYLGDLRDWLYMR